MTHIGGHSSRTRPVLLDRYERKILHILQRDASLSVAAIADQVGLSQQKSRWEY